MGKQKKVPALKSLKSNAGDLTVVQDQKCKKETKRKY